MGTEADVEQLKISNTSIKEQVDFIRLDIKDIKESIKFLQNKIFYLLAFAVASAIYGDKILPIVEKVITKFL